MYREVCVLFVAISKVIISHIQHLPFRSQLSITCPTPSWVPLWNPTPSENPYAHCTKETCPIENSVYGYYSNKVTTLIFLCSFRDIHPFASFRGHQMEIMILFDSIIDWCLRKSCWYAQPLEFGNYLLIICRICWTLPTSK